MITSTKYSIHRYRYVFPFPFLLMSFYLATKPIVENVPYDFWGQTKIHQVKLYKKKLPAFFYIAKRFVRSYHFNKFYSDVCFWRGDHVKNVPYVFGDQSKTHQVKLYKKKLPAFFYIAKRFARSYHLNKFFTHLVTTSYCQNNALLTSKRRGKKNML